MKREKRMRRRLKKEEKPNPKSEEETGDIVGLEATKKVNGEFVRPEWHKWVYGGVKKGE